MANAPEEKRVPFGTPSIRTMKTDIDEALRKDRPSIENLVSKDGRARFSHAPSEGAKTLARLLTIFLVVLLLLGSVGGGIYWYQKRSTTAPVPKTLAIPRPFLPVEKTAELRIKKDDRTGLLNALQARQQENTTSGLLYAPLVIGDFASDPSLGTPEDFFSALRISPPGDFFTSLSGTWNIYFSSGNIILIFETRDWLKTLGSLLRWESTMIDELTPILARAPDPGQHEFEDLLIRNHSVRIAKLSPFQDIALAHVIVQQRFLVLTSSEASVREMIDRLVAGPVNY